jgi:hypothetical protein
MLQKTTQEKSSPLINISLKTVPYQSEHSTMALTELPDNMTMKLAQQLGVQTTETNGKLTFAQ